MSGPLLKLYISGHNKLSNLILQWGIGYGGDIAVILPTSFSSTNYITVASVTDNNDYNIAGIQTSDRYPNAFRIICAMGGQKFDYYNQWFAIGH